MGNANCTKCFQDCDGGKEIDLKPSVKSTQIILRAYGNLRNSNSFDAAASRILKKKPEKHFASAREIECAIVIQKNWRTFISQRQYSLIKRVLKQNHRYFKEEEVRYTVRNIKVASELVVKRFSYPCGVYEGEWLGGFRHGTGTMVWSDNSSYSGCWSFGYPFGKGKFFLSSGKSFTGEFRSPYIGCNSNLPEKLSGCLSKITDGYLWLWTIHETRKTAKDPKKTLKQDFEKQTQKIESRIEAQNLIIKDTQNQLEETFKNFDKRFREIELETGNKYTGEMDSGKRDGKGINKWENGDKYIGEWMKDLQHGKGWNVWIDGSSYIGCYKNGQKDGLGEYIWDDGTSYIGGWKENSIDGVGLYLWKDGRKYIGEWSGGSMHGFGIFTAKDGKKYECKWQNGKKQGMGITHHKDGRSVIDYWENGKLQRTSNT